MTKLTNLDPLMKSEKQDWCTPQWLVDRIHQFRPIGLDVCTNANNPTRAAHFYTPAEDGLSKSWVPLHGTIWFCNEPYRDASLWLARAKSEWKVKHAEGIVLTPARTDTRYFHDSVFDGASAILFLKGRLKFEDPITGVASNSAPFPSCLIYYGPVPVQFLNTFHDLGSGVLL